MLEMILIRGAMVGAVYASLAVGFSLVFSVARIVNLAHTAFYMMAAYALFVGTSMLGVNMAASMIISLLLVTAVGVGCYKLFLERLQRHEGPAVLLTVALALGFQELMLLLFGSTFRGVKPLIAGTVNVIGVTVPIQQLLILGITIMCLLATVAFLNWSNLGLAMRVTAQDRETANLMGINVNRVAMFSMALATTLAAVAGVLVAPTYFVEPYMWQHPLVMMFAAVILGGLGSMKGGFIGAFIIGYMEVLVVFLIPGGSFIKGSVALVLVVIMLFLKPEGLFGAVFEEERL